MIYNVSSISVVQQSGPITHCSLCYIGGPRCPFIPSLTVCLHQSQTSCPSHSHPLPPLATTSLLSLALICLKILCFGIGQVSSVVNKAIPMFVKSGWWREVNINIHPEYFNLDRKIILSEIYFSWENSSSNFFSPL